MSDQERLNELEREGDEFGYECDAVIVREAVSIARRVSKERDTAIGRCGYFQEQVDHLKSRMDGTSVIPCCNSKAEVQRLEEGITTQAENLNGYMAHPEWGEGLARRTVKALRALLGKTQ